MNWSSIFWDERKKLILTSPPQESARGCGEQALVHRRCRETLDLSWNQLRAPVLERWRKCYQWWREPTSYVIVLGSWSMKTSWAMFIPSASLKSPTYWWYYDQNVLPKQEDAAPPPLSILQRWRRWGHRPGQPSWWPPSPPSTPATPPSSLFLVTCKELGKQVKLLTVTNKRSTRIVSHLSYSKMV